MPTTSRWSEPGRRNDPSASVLPRPTKSGELRRLTGWNCCLVKIRDVPTRWRGELRRPGQRQQRLGRRIAGHGSACALAAEEQDGDHGAEGEESGRPPIRGRVAVQRGVRPDQRVGGSRWGKPRWVSEDRHQQFARLPHAPKAVGQQQSGAVMGWLQRSATADERSTHAGADGHWRAYIVLAAAVAKRVLMPVLTGGFGGRVSRFARRGRR